MLRPRPSIADVRLMSRFEAVAGLLVRAVLGCALATSLPAADYYVSTGGSNSNSGSEASPFLTIQHAVDVAAAGDNVFIRGGVYSERVTISGKSGTALLPITFASYPGEQAIVDQFNVSPPAGDSALLRIVNSDYIIIRGIEFSNWKTAADTATPIGIFITGACNGVRLEDNKIHDIWQSNTVDGNFNANAHGIAVYGNSATAIDNLVLDGNEVYNLRLGASEAVVLNGNVTNFQVLRNVVHDCNNIGIDFIGFEGVNGTPALDQARNGVCAENVVYNIDTQFNPAYGGNFDGSFPDEDTRNATRAAAGIYVDGGASITIERNHVHHCNFGMEVASEHSGMNASAIVVRNNLLRLNHVAGLFLGGAGGGNGGVVNSSVTHNTIFQNDTAGYGGGQIGIQHHVSGTLIRHNIVVCNSSTAQFVLYDASGSSFAANAIDWNLYSGASAGSVEFIWGQSPQSTFTNWKSASGQDAHSFFAPSPGFVNAGAGDFNLVSSSAAVNKGDPTFTPASGELDYGGLDRLVGAAVDIGMDEYGLASPVIQFASATYGPVSEKAGQILVTLARSGSLSTAFDVTFTTGDLGDTAVADTDYTSHAGAVVHFDGNQTSAQVAVDLADRTGVQGSRDFTVTLSSPTDGALLGANATAAVTIIDAAGVLSIDEPAGSTLVVNEGATLQIPILRTNGSDGAVGFTITGTGGNATAGSDYSVPAIPQTLGDGVTTLDVPVTIFDPPGTSEPNETFTVSISAPTGGASLGAVTSVQVRIIDSVDTAAPPAPKIVFPASGAVLGLPTGDPITLTGSATDGKGVGSVKVSFNGGGEVDADVAAPGAPSTAWSLDVTPITGTNTITVRSLDNHGNPSTSVSRSFTVTRPLAVDFNSSLGGVTAGFAPSSYRQVGRAYTITATPKTSPAPGGVFVGWTLGGQDVAMSGAAFTPQRLGTADVSLGKQTLTFIFREGLQLTANFAANPYDPATVAGTYNGLIRSSATLPDRADPAEDGTAPATSSEGYFTATVQSTGAFSAKLIIDGLTLNLAGAFDEQGRARFGTSRALTATVARSGKPSLIVKLDIGGPSGSTAPAGKITGTVTATEFRRSIVAAVSDVDADRAYYTGTTTDLTVPDDYLTVTGTAASPAGRSDGLFTVILPSIPLGGQPTRISDAFTVLDYPQGAGVGTLKVTKTGTVTLTGSLADGTSVTASSTLSQDLRAALFAQLYSLKGFFSTQVKLDSTQAATDLAVAGGSEVLWSRPFLSTSHYYPYGWPEVLTLDLKGAKYLVTSGQSVMKAPDGADGDDFGDLLQTPDADGNIALHFTEGQLSEELIKLASVSTSDAVTKVPDNDPTFTATITRTNGSITGTVTHTDDTVPAYKAVIYQKGPDAGAYGFFLTKQPTPIDYTGESGNVLIIGEP